MKTIVKALDLSNAVLKVVKAVSTRGINPILECIKLVCKGDSLTLIATDNEIAIEKTIKAETYMEGETLVTGKLFAEFIKKLEEEDDLELYLDDNRLKITYSSSVGFIQAIDPEDFPVITKEIKENSFTMVQKDFKSLVNKTSFCCLQDDSRPILKGCLLEAERDMITCVALDGRRLALCKKPVKEVYGKIKAIVPSRALNEIIRLLDNDEDLITVIIQDRNLMVEVENTILTARLLEGEYIDYKQIIPTNFLTEFKANKVIFENAVERAAVVSRGVQNHLVKFDIKENCVNITATSEMSNINENVLISLEGKDILIAFNSKYVLDCMHVLEDDFVKISLTTPISPCVIRPNSDENVLYLIVPIRING
ncbi:MAG: DNA polymerase III subunit beta [Clostridia bacterium]|nr:DNA polymerase III subunit beta [Clostridia bacterium]